MLHTSTDINQLIRQPVPDPDFPHAPMDWTREDALDVARKEGLALTDDHWETIRAPCKLIMRVTKTRQPSICATCMTRWMSIFTNRAA